MTRALFGFTSVLTLVIVIFIAAWLAVFARYRLPATTITPGEIGPETGIYSATLPREDMERVYLLHVPPAAAAGRLLPVLILLPSACATANRTLVVSGLGVLADAQAFYIAMPQGFRGN